MGLDVGDRRIGVAVSDPLGLTAQPVLTLTRTNRKQELKSLSRLIRKYGCAGIIVGNDTATGTRGIAPDVKLTSVKIGTAAGAADVSQMIAALDWVVQHRNDDPANPIRVVNLSYDSGGTPTTTTDPLQYAVEKAWKAGIVVVQCSRAASGRVAPRRRLRENGIVAGEDFSPQKARILLMLLLAQTRDIGEIQTGFSTY